MKPIQTILLISLSLSFGCLLLVGCLFRSGKTPSQPKAKPTPTDWFEKGTTWAEKGNVEKAINAFNKAIKLDSLYTAAYFYRAQMWEATGELNRAVSDYTKVLKQNPKLERAYNYRGNVWQMIGKFDKAIADYTKALEMNPDHPGAYHNRGNAWGKKGEFDQAIADFNRALELTPNEAAIYDNRGSAWRKKGEYGKAIADYVKALDVAPTFAVTYNNLAWLLATCPDGKYRSGVKALKLAEKALELMPDASALDTLAAAYAEAGRFEDAVRVMERIITMVERGETENLSIYKKHITSYRMKKPWRAK